jgi:sensor histidine kinase regulating citrate/malate metabolism
MAWFLMQVILKSAFSSSQAIRKMEEQNRILALQESQFRSQQKYIKASERARHDFRHTILTLSGLFKAGNTEALGRYLDQYVEAVPSSEFTAFCSNTALNALLNYFLHISEQSGIDLTLRVDLPDELPVSDVDLCSMVGNILENAVAGCRNAEEKEIQLTVLIEDHAQLYIVAVNSFDGIVRQSGGRYLSVKHAGEGFGLSSIRSAAESYGGVAQFSHEGNRFFSNVAIPLR